MKREFVEVGDLSQLSGLAIFHNEKTILAYPQREAAFSHGVHGVKIESAL